jgi:hypothetical protein
VTLPRTAEIQAPAQEAILGGPSPVMARTGGPDPGLDAMMVRDFNCARDAAKTADDLLASNRRGPWIGIAMANQRILQPVGKTGNTKVQGCDATGGRSHARTCFRGHPS